MAKAEAISTAALRELTQALRRNKDNIDNKSGMRKGAIISIQGGNPPTCTVTIGGDPTEIPGVGYVQNYRPVVGDTVLMNQQKNDLTIVDKVADSLTPGRTTDGLSKYNNGIKVYGADTDNHAFYAAPGAGIIGVEDGFASNGGATITGGLTTDTGSTSGSFDPHNGTVSTTWQVNGTGTALTVPNGNMSAGGGLTLSGTGTTLSVPSGSATIGQTLTVNGSGGTRLDVPNGDVSCGGTVSSPWVTSSTRLFHSGSSGSVGFYGVGPVTRQSVTGDVNGGVGAGTATGLSHTANALWNFITAVAATGIVNCSSMTFNA